MEPVVVGDDSMSPEQREQERNRLNAEQARQSYEQSFRAALHLSDVSISKSIQMDPRTPPALPVAQTALLRQLVLELHVMNEVAGTAMHLIGGLGAELSEIKQELAYLSAAVADLDLGSGEAPASPGKAPVPAPGGATLAEVFAAEESRPTKAAKPKAPKGGFKPAVAPV